MSPKSEVKLRSIVRLLLGEPPDRYLTQRDRETCLFVFCGEGIWGSRLTDTGDAISGKTGVFG